MPQSWNWETSLPAKISALIRILLHHFDDPDAGPAQSRHLNSIPLARRTSTGYPKGAKCIVFQSFVNSNTDLVKVWLTTCKEMVF